MKTEEFILGLFIIAALGVFISMITTTEPEIKKTDEQKDKDFDKSDLAKIIYDSTARQIKAIEDRRKHGSKN